MFKKLAFIILLASISQVATAKPKKVGDDQYDITVYITQIHTSTEDYGSEGFDFHYILADGSGTTDEAGCSGPNSAAVSSVVAAAFYSQQPVVLFDTIDGKCDVTTVDPSTTSKAPAAKK